MAVMYDIDAEKEVIFRQEHLPDGANEEGPVRARARTVQALKRSGNTFAVSLETLYEYGSRLGHRDVLENMSDPHICEECGKSFQNLQDLKDCDNSFPNCVRQSFPIDAQGRQYKCRRGRICNPIGGSPLGCYGSKDHVPKNTKGWKKHIKSANYVYYTCVACTKGSTHFMDVWGEDVRTPGIDSAPNSLSPTDVPKLPWHDDVPPYIQFEQSEGERSASYLKKAAQIFSRGGASVIDAAAGFLRFVRSAFLSKNQEDYLLRYIHERHEKSKEAYQNDFGKDATAQYPKNPLPLTHETVEAYAAPVVVLEKDIKFYKFRISTHNLKFRQAFVECHAAEIKQVLQAKFLDPRFNLDGFYCQGNQVPREYTNGSTGEKMYGPEVIHGKRWFTLEKTIGWNQRLLYLIISMDKTDSGKSSQYPYQLKIGNFSQEDGRKKFGCVVFAVGPILPYEKSNSTHETSNLTDTQAGTKAATLSFSCACCLLALEELAKKEQTFYFKDMEHTITVVVRVGIFAADYEETKHQCQVSGSNACGRCRFLEIARLREIAEGRNDPINMRAYMRPDRDLRCGYALPRTVEFVVSQQAEIMKTERFSFKYEAQELIRITGVNPHAENMLHRHQNLFPHESGSMYAATAPDVLHAVLSGVLNKFNVAVWNVIKIFHRTDLVDFGTDADARDRQDYRLSNGPTFPGNLHYTREFIYKNIFTSNTSPGLLYK